MPDGVGSPTWQKLDGYFRSALDHPTWSAWRKHARDCFAYKEGDQWTAAEVKELEKRGQPATVNNQVKVTLDRLVGQFVKQRTRIGYKGRNPDDEATANVLTDLFRFIRQNSGLEFEERDAAEDGFCGGFGVIEACVTFDKTFQPEIRIRSVDPFEMYVDPYSRRYDWNEDAQFICRAKWLDFQEAAELYPEHRLTFQTLGDAIVGDGSVEALRNDNYIDFDEQGRPRRVRLVECWYKTRERQQLLLVDDPMAGSQTLDVATLTRRQRRDYLAGGAMEIDRVDSRLSVGVFTAGALLRHKGNPHGTDLFPFVPFLVHRRKNGEPYSLIWTALTLQDAINKRESKALHLLNTNQAIIGQNAVQDKVELAEEMARPDGIIEVRNLEQFQLQRNTELAQGQLLMHQEGKADFRRVTGVNPEALGERSEVRSGVGIARKQQMTDLVVAPVYDNFRRTRILLARLTLALVQHYYREPKVFAITDDLGAARTVVLGEDVLGRAKQAIYDVVVEEQPDLITLQQEQFALLMQGLPQILPFGPAWVELLIQMSELRNKEDLIKRVQAMAAPQPPEPRVSVNLQWAVMTPEEKVAWAEKFGMPKLMQAQMMNPQPTQGERDQQSDQGYQQMAVDQQMLDMQQGREMHEMKMAQLGGKMAADRMRDMMKLREANNGEREE